MVPTQKHNSGGKEWSLTLSAAWGAWGTSSVKPIKKVLQGKFCRLPATDGHNETHLADVVQKQHMEPEVMEVARSREQLHVHTNGRKLTLGSIGCYESHFRAMELIAKNGAIDFGIIAEDDLSLFSPDFELQFDKLVNDSAGEATALWHSTDIIYLQSCNQGWFRDKVFHERHLYPTSLRDVSHKHVACTGMYAVSRSAAKWLTAPDGPLLPIKMQIDAKLPHHVDQIRAKAFRPSIAQTLGSTKIDTDVQLLIGVEHTTWLDC